jgi:hypothetical protein
MRTIKESKPANDSVNPSCIKAVSKQQIRVLTKFLPILEKINPHDFSHSVRLPGNEDVCYGIGHVEFHPAVYEFTKACYGNAFVQPSFDWPAWAKEARRYMADPALVASARLATCIKLITAHLRYERFCDGHLHSVFESGHLTAVLRRLKVILEKADRTSASVRG